MSRENIELAKQYVAALNAGGLDAVEPLWHDKIELNDPVGVPDAGRFLGRDAVRRRIESYLELGWDGQIEVEEMVDAGDEVVLIWRLRGTTPLGGFPLDTTFFFVVLFEDGKVRRFRQYLSKGQALEAAGLSDM